jgi:predicted site-specific integrase-resolvase
MKPIYLTTTQVADAIGVHRYTVLKWCKAGIVDGAIRLPSGCWRIPARTVESMTDSGTPHSDVSVTDTPKQGV